jgi:hypothetical protein
VVGSEKLQGDYVVDVVGTPALDAIQVAHLLINRNNCLEFRFRHRGCAKLLEGASIGRIGKIEVLVGLVVIPVFVGIAFAVAAICFDLDCAVQLLVLFAPLTVALKDFCGVVGISLTPLIVDRNLVLI